MFYIRSQDLRPCYSRAVSANHHTWMHSKLNVSQSTGTFLRWCRVDETPAVRKQRYVYKPMSLYKTRRKTHVQERNYFCKHYTLLLVAGVTGCNLVRINPAQTQTLQPTAIPGWEKFEGEKIELWLPESYEGGNLQEDLDVIAANLRRLGPDYEQMAQFIEQNKDLFVLWAFDSDIGSSGLLTNVNVTTERVVSAVTIDSYLDATIAQLPPQFQVVEREKISLDRHQAGKLVTEFTIAGIEGKQALYVIKDGTTVWVTVFTTGAEEFEQRLPVFEQSINNFWVRP